MFKMTSETQQNATTSPTTSPQQLFGNVFNTAKQGLVSDETRDAIFAVYTWLMPVNSLLTVIFCVINAAVYWQQRAATFALYLIGVDIGDGLCAVLKLCSNVAYFTLPAHTFDRHLIDWYMAKYLAISFRRAATCLNTLAALERFLAIAFPLKNISRRAFGKPMLIIPIVFLACLLAYSFMAFEYHVVLGEDGDWRLTVSEWKMANPGVFVIVGHVTGTVFSYAPLTAILVLNFLLLVMLRVHASRLKHVRRSHGSNSEDMVYRTSVQSKMTPNSTHFNSQVTNARHDSHPREESSLRSNHKAENVKTTQGSLQDIHQHYTKGPTESDSQKTPPAQHSKKTPNAKLASETSITKMVMVFTTVFCLLALPSVLSSTARHLLPEYGPQGREANLFRTVSTLSMLVSHLTEPALFWVSFAYSRHFRRAVFRLPGARWCCGRCLAVTSFLSTSSSDVNSRSSRGTLFEGGAH